MIAHFVICALGSADLLRLAVASIHKFAGESTLDIVTLSDKAVGDAHAHGRALDQWRDSHEREQVSNDDVVVIMDPDAVILSLQWRKEMEATFTLMPKVGIWGAGCREDFGLRVHPSMMAIRGTLFNTSSASFKPYSRKGDRDWRDTAGWYCKVARDKGWRLWREERALGHDWHGAAAWCHWRAPNVPMWVHLGGGTWSDPARLTWWQRQRRRQAIKTRRRFIAACEEVLVK